MTRARVSVKIVTKTRHKVKAKATRAINYPSTEHWHSWVISFIFDMRTALESLDLNGSSKKVQISFSMETVKQFNFSFLT